MLTQKEIIQAELISRIRKENSQHKSELFQRETSVDRLVGCRPSAESLSANKNKIKGETN